MGFNKSKKFVKVSAKPAKPVVEEIEEIEELDEVEESEDEVVEEVKPAKKSARKSKKAEPIIEDVEEEDEDSDDTDDVSFDTDAVIKGIVSDKQNLTSAVYQVQLRLPAEIEPLYKGLSPRLKKALRDAFAELVKKAYKQTH